MNASSPVLLIFAHPDDEAFGCAGLLATLAERGVPASLVCATRGELGGISDERLATPETLGAVRETELRDAMALVGVSDVRFLGYRDSGMAGTGANDDPRALMRAPDAELLALLTVQIRQIRPATVVTFGPDGVYGHPDHLRVHHASVAAIRAAAEPTLVLGSTEPWRIASLYFNTAPRERLAAWSNRPNSPFSGLTDEQLAQLGTPAAEITHIIDVERYLDLKRQVLLAHRTQVGDGGPMVDLPPEAVAQMLSREQLVRAPLPWDQSATSPDDIIDQLPRGSLEV